ncbi:MAG: hypothetical protein IPL20_02965 [Saprospiraceae bacterium]|nr:hypothetical protein [Saprospiraceae bacterium]
MKNLKNIHAILCISFFLNLKIYSQSDSLIFYDLQEVTIIAKKLLDKISDNQIDSTTIVKFPSHQPYDIFTLAPGISRRGRDIIVRGGNRNDIDWQFEGISVRDPQTSGYIHSVNNNAIGLVKFSPRRTYCQYRKRKRRYY